MRSLFLLLWLASGLRGGDDNWPQFRGAQAAGVAEGHSLPTKFDIGKGVGVKWRVATAGLGLSSPVIWGDQLFLTTAISKADGGKLRTGLYGDIASVEDSSEHVWKALAYDKRTGDLLWERELHRGVPAVKRHEKSSHASATVATDGERLLVLLGSEGLYCLDMDGNTLWKKSLGVLDAGFFRAPEAQWEFGSSPVIHEGKALILADVQGGGFLTALRLEDGSEVWRVQRNDVPTWGAPLVATTGESTQVVVNGWRHTGGYDIETGEPLWRVNGGGDIPVPTPIFHDGRFFLTSAHGSQAPVYAVSAKFRGAIDLGAEGAQELDWLLPRKGAYMATPLLLDGLLYVLRWNGILLCLEPDTGVVVYEKRLPSGAYTASPVGGDGKLYVANEEGQALTIRSGRDFAILSKTAAPDPILATPAISQGVLYIRTGRELIAIGP